MEDIKECKHPWMWMVVSADGTTKPCCWASGNIGNLNQSSAEEIWNGTLTQELRSSILSNTLHPICFNSPCVYVQNHNKKIESIENQRGSLIEELDQEKTLKLTPKDITGAFKIFLNRYPNKEELEKALQMGPNELLKYLFCSDKFLKNKGIAQLLQVCANKIIEIQKRNQ